MKRSTCQRNKTGYKETTDWIFGLDRFVKKPGLKNVRRLLELTGDPQERFKSIHITGTNGKGSTAVMVASILAEAGYMVGIYTSPHLSSFTERIVVDGKKIPEEEVVRLVNEIRPVIDKMTCGKKYKSPTFFEVITAIAFRYFAEQKVDFAVVEVGMGGRTDATNVVDSLVSVITNVSLEHTKYLGNTVIKIASEKAGIIKKGGVLITAADDGKVLKLFREVCKDKVSRMFRVGKDIKFKKVSSDLKGQRFGLDGLFNRFNSLFVPLLGYHQLVNASTAIGAVEALRYHGITIQEKYIADGLKNVRWPGRLEVMQKNPLVVLDCAKDPVAAEKLKEAVLENFKYKRLIVVVSISSDKDVTSMIEQMSSIADMFVITEHKVRGRAARPETISIEVKKRRRPFVVVHGVKDAVKKALSIAGRDDMICVTGSVFTVGEARELWKKEVGPVWGRELND